jgi:molybdopterin synthase catalytic subunit
MTDNITVRLRVFAGLREALGFSDLALQVAPGSDVASVLAQLARRGPEGALSRTRYGIAVNRAYAPLTTIVKHGDEIALLPPVSGGAARLFEISDKPISMDEVAGRVSGPDRGAIVCFAGVVRGITRARDPEGCWRNPEGCWRNPEGCWRNPEGCWRDQHAAELTTDYLEYEAFPEMAEAAFAEIAAEVQARWPAVSALSIVHRVGRLEVGDLAVVIAVAAGHRRDTFDACRHTIDRIKQIAPIWKKEVGSDGAIWVEGPESEVEREA